MRAALVAAFLGLCGCAAADRRSSDEVALRDARPIGGPVDCVTLSNIRDTRVRDDRTIDFYLRDGRILRNQLPNRCSGLGFEESFSYETSLSRLCSTDIIRVRTSSGMQGPACGLGHFQQIEMPMR